MRNSWAFLLALILAGPAQALESEAVRIPTRDDVEQAFVLIRPEVPPVASVILFAGGDGDIGIEGNGAVFKLRKNGNFLVRSRHRFAKLGFLVAVPDVPSGQGGALTASFRMGERHAQDIAAIAARLKSVAPVPVWAIGTSMGTFSAANAAIRLGGIAIDGLVLTSTITSSPNQWAISGSHPEAVLSMDLGRIAVPSLVVAHDEDACFITPAKDAPRLVAKLAASAKAELMRFSGGKPPTSTPCEAYAAHGFLGIEDEVVGAIGGFITAATPDR